MRCPDDFWHSCPLNKSNVHIAEQPNSHKISCGHQACAKHFEIWVEGNSGIMLGWHHVQISLVSFLQTARKGRPASNVAKYDEKSKKEKNITNVWQKTCKNLQKPSELSWELWANTKSPSKMRSNSSLPVCWARNQDSWRVSDWGGNFQKFVAVIRFGCMWLWNVMKIPHRILGETLWPLVCKA